MKYGLSVPVSEEPTQAGLERTIALVLVPDAVRTLSANGKELCFTVSYSKRQNTLEWCEA